MKMIGSAIDRSISRTIFPTILISVILTSVFVVPLAPQGAAENPMLRLDPSDSIFYTNQTALGDRFNVTVWFENTPATSIYNFQVDFTYDGSILNVTSWYEPAWDPSYVFYGKSTVTGTPFYYHDSVLGKDGIVGGICLIGGDAFSGQAGKLCVLELQITRVPTPNASLGCVLGFRRGGTYGTYVLDPDDHELQGIMQDGSYLITDQQIPHHDIAVSHISSNRYFAIIGELVNIRVNLTNLGDVYESSNVTVYADTDTAIIGDEIVVGTQAAEVPLRSSVLLDFSWNTSDASPGSLTISAMADTVPGETDISNNILIDGTVAVVAIIHDIAVTYIRTSEQFAYVGDTLNVEVDVQNQGNSAEQTAVYAYAAPLAGANIAIGTSTISLARYISRTITFMWNTTGLSASNYSLSAFVAPVSGEADLNDNNLTRGLVVLYTAVPCPDINITFPTALTVNPSIFTYDPHFGARLISIGNISVVSTGFAGGLRVVGSTNGTIHLCVDHPGVDEYPFYLPLYGEVQVPLWLMFQPETHWEQYNGDFTLNLLNNIGTGVPAKTRKILFEMLATNINSLNPKFHVKVLELDWYLFWSARTSRQFPIFMWGWLADYLDPHNFVSAYYTAWNWGGWWTDPSMPGGGVPWAVVQGFQDPIIDSLIEQGIRMPDGPARAQIYSEIQQRVIDLCPSIALYTPVHRHFEQTWVCGWYYNPAQYGNIYAADIWKWYYTPHAQLDVVANDTANSLPYDVNYDGKTNMIDIGTTAASFGAIYGPPMSAKWNFRCDFNNDRKTDMKDIGRVAKNFGKTSAVWNPS